MFLRSVGKSTLDEFSSGSSSAAGELNSKHRPQAEPKIKSTEDVCLYIFPAESSRKIYTDELIITSFRTLYQEKSILLV